MSVVQAGGSGQMLRSHGVPSCGKLYLCKGLVSKSEVTVHGAQNPWLLGLLRRSRVVIPGCALKVVLDVLIANFSQDYSVDLSGRLRCIS